MNRLCTTIQNGSGGQCHCSCPSGFYTNRSNLRMTYRQTISFDGLGKRGSDGNSDLNILKSSGTIGHSIISKVRSLHHYGERNGSITDNRHIAFPCFRLRASDVLKRTNRFHMNSGNRHSIIGSISKNQSHMNNGNRRRWQRGSSNGTRIIQLCSISTCRTAICRLSGKSHSYKNHC